MIRLTDTQNVLLSAAAKRDDRSMLPVPETLTATGRRLDRSLAALLRRGLIEERPACGGGVWRRDDDDGDIGLFIAAAGLAAIGVEDESVADKGLRVPSVDDVAAPERPVGKLGALLDAMERDAGATLDELATSASWLPHTTRAAITRLRQRGFNIRLEERDGRKAYRVTGAV